MKRNDDNIEEVLRQSLPSASKEQLESARGRVYDYATSDATVVLGEAEIPARRRFGWGWIPALTAAAVVIASIWVSARWQDRGVYAVLETPSGSMYRLVADEKLVPIATGERIEAQAIIRSNGGSGGTLKLSDGSQVETRSQTEFWIERTEDGIRIRLGRGGLIVNAAKQVAGQRLYVQTRDVTVSVVGTVFLVNAAEEGSRVAVIEGEVRVRQGATEKELRPGDHVTTNPSMPSTPVKEEISWSRNAEAHFALLQQSATAAGAPAVTQLREAFDVATIRPYDPGAPTGARGGRVWAVGGCGGDPQVDPARFAVTGTTLHHLIVWAYGTKNANTEDCRGYTALNLMSGGPEWIRSDQWDVQATMPVGSPGYTVQQLRKGDAPKLQAMLRTLLEDRFQLVVRREPKEVPAYSLMLGKDATSQPVSREASSRIWNGSSYTSQWLTKRPEDWQPFVPGSVAHERGPNAQSPEYYGYFTGSDASMSDLVLMLGQKPGRPVVDRTVSRGPSIGMSSTPRNSLQITVVVVGPCSTLGIAHTFLKRSSNSGSK
jgi:uncharacterized protein (TIGR03435 family)